MMTSNQSTGIALTNGNKQKLRKSQRRWLLRLERFIDDRLDDPGLSVTDLADAALVSERQLYRKLQKYTGLTPRAFLRTRRLARARQLLSAGQISSVNELAREVGYQRSDYFSKVFTDVYGTPPVDYIDN